MRKYILLGILSLLLLYISPVGGMIQYNIGMSFYSAKKYEQAIPWFERALLNSPSNNITRLYYVIALSKLKPTYSVQEKLYKISESKYEDQAKNFAKSRILMIKHDLLKDFEDNYIGHAIEGKDVKRWDMKSFPLKIYIENSNGKFPSYYKEEFQKAFQAWSDSTNFIKFKNVSTKEDADIYVEFPQNTQENCQNCAFTIANTYPIFAGDNLLKQMKISFFPKLPNGRDYLRSEVYHTAIHEIGHALGISGHSDNSEDVMYASNDNVYSLNHIGQDYLSKRDLNTIVLLYRLKPSISNNKKIYSENFYYPPLIIGSNDEILNKKLNEWLKYVEDYPNTASGYGNVATTYFDMGNFEKSLEYLKKAEEFANSPDEFWSIYYNRALIYYNLSDISNAKIYLQKAKELKNSKEIEDLSNAINKLK